MSPLVVFVALKVLTVFALFNRVPPMELVVKVVPLIMPVSDKAPLVTRFTVLAVLIPVTLKALESVKLIAPASLALPAAFKAFNVTLPIALWVLFKVIDAPPVFRVCVFKLFAMIAAPTPVPVWVIALPPIKLTLLVVLMPATSNPLTSA